ncbi:MAG TPA: ABC transporter substrate-binding protein [Candidatus Tectomicrobia bacterium]|nr:ABC transporter substrate-binding protein [Candidatus Tectomicrobia bacterium]
MSEPIRIQFTRFSAFYSPLIATIAAGFLRDEGFEPHHSVAPAGRSAIEGVAAGTVDVCQSAPSQAFTQLEKGQAPPAVHFAQINEKDGFFLTARVPDPGFTWDRLRGRRVLVDHGGQPLAMFKYGCHRRGVDYDSIHAIDIPSGQMDQAFRKGEGDYIHQQGPAPQQLEHDGVGHIVASVGDAIGPCAFSSLAASREWLRTEAARRFMRAYRRARAWLLETPAAQVAEVEASFFPGIDRAVLASTIATYQRLGCWTPHVEITRPAFERTLDVFLHAGLITRRHRYEDVVAPPPDGR